MAYKFIRYSFLGLLGIVLLYILTALVLSYIPTNPKAKSCKKEKFVFVASNGVHLDIILPSLFLPDSIKDKLGLPFSSNFVAFGWGDKEFYINTPEWGDLNIGVTFRALFVKTPATLHVGWYKNSFSHWYRVDLCEHQLNGLLNYITAEFVLDSNEQYIRQSGYGETDLFFDAKSHFQFYKTCNVWVNQGLKEAEVKTSIWSPFDFGVLYHLKNQEKTK